MKGAAAPFHEKGRTSDEGTPFFHWHLNRKAEGIPEPLCFSSEGQSQMQLCKIERIFFQDIFHESPVSQYVIPGHFLS